MLRTLALSTALAVLLAGCGKSSSSARPVEGGRAPFPGTGTPGGAKPPGTGTGTGTGGTEPVADPGHKPPEPGWRPVEVSKDSKDLPYTSVFHISKLKGTVFVENLDRFIIHRQEGASGTGSSMTASDVVEVKTTWEIIGAGLIEKMKTSPDKTDVYYRLKGKRTMVKKYGPPPGMVGEKQEWDFAVEEVIWTKLGKEYSDMNAVLEEELWDDYLRIFLEDAEVMLKVWKKHQDTAEDLGWGLADLLRIRDRKPFHEVVRALERIAADDVEIAKKTGDFTEAAAWLRVLLEWAHFPGSVVSGDSDPDRANKAAASLAGRIRLLENQLRDRLRTGGLTIAPEEAGKLLSATDGTVAQKFCIFASESGRTQVAAEVALAIFQSKEKDDWKATTLSMIKNQVSTNPKFFDGWPHEAVLKFPGRLRDTVLPFSKGTLIPTRNVVAVLEALKKAKPGLAFSPSIDDVIAEMKKK